MASAGILRTAGAIPACWMSPAYGPIPTTGQASARLIRPGGTGLATDVIRRRHRAYPGASEIIQRLVREQEIQ